MNGSPTNAQKILLLDFVPQPSTVVPWIDPIGIDVVVCAIASQHSDRLDLDEFLIDASQPEFQQTGLRLSSKVRTTRIATLDRKLVMRKLGQLGEQYTQILTTTLT